MSSSSIKSPPKAIRRVVAQPNGHSKPGQKGFCRRFSTAVFAAIAPAFLPLLLQFLSHLSIPLGLVHLDNACHCSVLNEDRLQFHSPMAGKMARRGQVAYLLDQHFEVLTCARRPGTMLSHREIRSAIQFGVQPLTLFLGRKIA